MEPSGRLELTWTNKNLRLITRPDGGYEWVDPADPRVSEVRLLQEAGTVGDAAPGDGGDNLLIEGDALHALTALNRTPELARRYAGKVRLVYIDPPFNTGQAFANYDDNLEHSVWLSMLRDRLVQIKPLLAPNGSIWVHLDDAEVHRCRCVMDEVLGAGNFLSTVVWEKTTTGRNDAKHFSNDHDFLLVYARDKALMVPNGLARSASSDAAYRNPDNDPRGPWREDNYKCGKTADERPNLYYPVTHPISGDEVWPPRTSVWRYSREAHEEHLRAGLLWWGKTGNYRLPKVKRFRTSVPETSVPRTLWRAEDVDQTRRAKQALHKMFPDRTPFATPKPERLMERVIHIATDPGDIVLDCFAGSGTTAAVAHKMGRRWVTSEREADTIEQFTRPRLEKVVNGEDPGGITAAVEWQGGGGFRHLRVGPSMFDLDAETGDVFLAEWATNGAFAEAVAAQLGFERVDDVPFCGRKGRTRLAVLDGVVGAAEVEFLVSALDDRELLVVVGQAFTDDAEAKLRELSPGSKVRHAPHDLLRGDRRR